MAHTKSQGKTNQKSNRPGQRLGIKKSGGQKVTVGQIIARQVGSKYHSGIGTKKGKDFTVYAIRPGIVKFIDKLGKKFITVVRATIDNKKVVKAKKVVVHKIASKKVAFKTGATKVTVAKTVVAKKVAVKKAVAKKSAK